MFGEGTDNDTEDPNLPGPSLSTEECRKFKVEASDYASEMLEVYASSDVTGEDMSLQLTSTFREHSIVAMPTRTLVK